MGRLHGMLHLSAKRHRPIVWWENSIRDFLGKPFKGPIIPFGSFHWLSITYFCERPVKNPSIWKESLTWIVPWIRVVRGWNLEGWHIGCRPWGVGDDGRIGNLLEKTQCERGDISKRKWKIYVSNRRWTNQTSWRRSGLENIHLGTASTNSRRKESHVDFLGEPGGSLLPPQDSLPDAGEAINNFLSMSGNFIYRHHVEPRVKLYSPREESFPIPLKYIDVSRTTRTKLDVKQERRIDDYWNIDGSRDLSGSWTGFTRFILLEAKPPDGKMLSGERLTRKQLTSRPDHLWPEIWKTMGRNAKLKERQKWSHEKPQLDNAWKLRGIYFIDPEDKEFKETIKNARKKLETSVAPAMPCKISKKSQNRVTRGKTNEESTRLRMEESPPNHHEDHIAGKGDSSLQQYYLVHKIYSYASSHQDSRSKGSSG